MTRWEGPIVQSLHNYRAFCATGLLFREGSPCFECPNQGAWRSLIHGCYRGSRAATAPLAISRNGPAIALLRKLSGVITTSASSDALIRRLAPDLQTRLIHNFINSKDSAFSEVDPDERWIAMGRLSPEKGFVELIKDWPESERLNLIGNGPQWSVVEQLTSQRGIPLIPGVPREEMRLRLAGSLGLVFPSRWPEVAPLIVIEAMRLGIPVVSHEFNGVSDLVRETDSGLTYHDAQSLKSALVETRLRRRMLSRNALSTYERLWSKYAWLRETENLYTDLLAG